MSGLPEGGAEEQVHRDLRLGTQTRLRELVRDPGDEVALISAHDPWQFGHYGSLIPDP